MVLGLKNDITLTKEQLAKLQEQLSEEQAFRLNKQVNHSKDKAWLEKWIIKAIEGTVGLEKVKEAVSMNLMQERASSASTTAKLLECDLDHRGGAGTRGSTDILPSWIWRASVRRELKLYNTREYKIGYSLWVEVLEE